MTAGKTAFFKTLNLLNSMRTAEEIYESVMDDNLTVHATIVIAINEARKEAIEECAERAKVKNEYGEVVELSNDYEIDGISIRMNAGTKRQLKFLVDKQEILSLIKELK